MTGKTTPKVVAILISVIFFAVVNTHAQNLKTDFKHPLETKLQRFEVARGKEEKFKEWMDYLRREKLMAVATLDGERMYFEAVFTEKSEGGKLYVYWLTFNGKGGRAVENSTSELDRKHLEYWNECIVKGSRKEFGNEFYLMPEFVDKAIKERQKKEKN